MAATPSVVIKKTMSGRGGTLHFSNRYHFNGGTPSDDAHWHTLMDAVVAAEKLCYDNNVVIVEAVGYLAGGTVGVASKSYTTHGTFTAGGSDWNAPSDAAIVARWPTTARTGKNHPIYLFTYFRRVYINETGATGDTPSTGQKNAIQTYCAAWTAGFSDGANTLVRAGPNGATGGTPTVLTYITHRDFPR